MNTKLVMVTKGPKGETKVLKGTPVGNRKRSKSAPKAARKPARAQDAHAMLTADGYNVAIIRRLLPEDVAPDGNPHLLSDSEWERLIVTIAAIPEMVSTLRRLVDLAETLGVANSRLAGDRNVLVDAQTLLRRLPGE